MPRINSSDELEKFRKDVLSKRDPHKPCIAVCTGTGCLALGAASVVAALKKEIAKQIRRIGPPCLLHCLGKPIKSS